MDCFTAMTQIPNAGVDIVITDPPYPNGMRLFPDDILDGYAALYFSCKKARNYVVFFWGPTGIPTPPKGWYEVARHIWHKPDGRSINTYEVIVVWSQDYKRLSSRVWSIPILDYRSLKDWKPHPTQKPVKLLRYLLDLYTEEGDTVLDPFVGSGTTAVACKQLRRHFLCVDSNPEYVKIAKERLKDRTLPDDDNATKDTPTRDTPPLTDDGDAKDVTIAENEEPDGEPPADTGTNKRRPARRTETTTTAR
jgi:DNA modification methylase